LLSRVAGGYVTDFVSENTNKLRFIVQIREQPRVT
jgi:hypothetical protein